MFINRILNIIKSMTNEDYLDYIKIKERAVKKIEKYETEQSRLECSKHKINLDDRVNFLGISWTVCGFSMMKGEYVIHLNHRNPIDDAQQWRSDAPVFLEEFLKDRTIPANSK